jgi:hypothetical protein
MNGDPNLDDDDDWDDEDDYDDDDYDTAFEDDGFDFLTGDLGDVI